MGGSIPACTGKPPSWQRILRGSRVYPRMYGETEQVGKAVWVWEGLSPHVRGNPAAMGARLDADGSIPACTGKPRRCCGAAMSRWVYPRMYGEPATAVTPGFSLEVYPRMYGETPASPPDTAHISGLSPHVRGNQRRPHRRHGHAGSIPACTGKPSQAPSIRGGSAVYPRMYGETGAGAVTGAVMPGLSPHVRGNPADAGTGAEQAGSIPACTGKPCSASRPPGTPGVYPRMYGETSNALIEGRTVEGLSPHVRGNRRMRGTGTSDAGSIPACTGKPGPQAGGSLRAWVYPRMYGETTVASLPRSFAPGLSPHVRGNPVFKGAGPWEWRSIPACTGKPLVCAGGWPS